MATPETLTPTRRLKSAALAERDRVTRELHRLERRRGALAAELNDVESALADVREHLKLLNRLTHDRHDSPFAHNGVQSGQVLEATPPAAAPPPRAVLRGAQIREAAVRLIAGSDDPTRLIHYKEWFELLERERLAVAGRNPLASFLTQLNRSPVVRRASRPGTYALDFDAPRRLREQLAATRREMIELEPDMPLTSDEVLARRKQRAALMNCSTRMERDLEEALRLLGPEAEIS